jgi:uncharacterized SAM-binding protein YcdF (DUF218 family)
MFFVLSKVLLFLLVPFWWILILLIWRFFSKSLKIKKALSIVIIAILIIFSNSYVYRQANLLWQPSSLQLDSSSHFEAGIVLGGMAGYDRNDKGYFGDNADRFIQTANLYHKGIIQKIIISGGTGSLSQKEPPEAVFLFEQFKANGIPDSAIILEERSRNTYENAIYSKKICDSLQIRSPFLLITSAQHMRRSLDVFKKAGFDCIAYPCDYKSVERDFSLGELLLPRIKLLEDWSNLLKEIVGLYVYKLTNKA